MLAQSTQSSKDKRISYRDIDKKAIMISRLTYNKLDFDLVSKCCSSIDVRNINVFLTPYDTPNNESFNQLNNHILSVSL